MSPSGHRKGAGRPRAKRAPVIPPAEIESDVMTLHQVAEYLDCSYATVLLLVMREGPFDISVKRRRRWLDGIAKSVDRRGEHWLIGGPEPLGTHTWPRSRQVVSSPGASFGRNQV
jgi:hypothetical protein